MKLSKSIKMVGILLKVDVLLKVMYFFKDGEVFKNWRVLVNRLAGVTNWRVLVRRDPSIPSYNTVIVIFFIKKILLSSRPPAI